MGTVPELESYRAAIDSVPMPVFSVFGGHDGNIERRSTTADTPCTRNFEATLGPTYYSFDWGGYHFVIYATEESYFSAADRARKERWLWADLALQPSDRQSVLMLHTAPDEDLLAKFSGTMARSSSTATGTPAESSNSARLLLPHPRHFALAASTRGHGGVVSFHFLHKESRRHCTLGFAQPKARANHIMRPTRNLPTKRQHE